MPSYQTPSRKTAAIMFTDIAGYTSLTSKDELAALQLVNKKNSILKPLIGQYNGTHIKDVGDGTLSSFQSASDASLCAVKFQESVFTDDQMNVRIGIHYGETIFTDDDVFGDVVNIASRIESMSISGGVFISKDTFDQLSGEEEFDTISLGLQAMKGVGRLVEIYALKEDHLAVPDPEEYAEKEIKTHKDDDVPSLAIIPFLNKGKEEDVFYTYGISADLIADVSGAGTLRISSMKDIEKIDHGSLSSSEISEQLTLALGKTFTLRRVESVGPKIGKELQNDALKAIGLALLLILIYITFRFDRYYALGSVMALIHDVLITLGVFSLLDYEINLSIIAAFLTIVGYSLNDTIVVFDRIRESIPKLMKKTLNDVVNISLNETLNRTVITSLTTMMVVVILFLWGGKVINLFAFALIIGVFVGTYSSLFVASPVMVYFEKRSKKQFRK